MGGTQFAEGRTRDVVTEDEVAARGYSPAQDCRSLMTLGFLEKQDLQSADTKRGVRFTGRSTQVIGEPSLWSRETLGN